MTLTVSKSNERTPQLYSKYEDDFHCVELLEFLGKHPYTRFSRLALVHAINNGKLIAIDKALKRLVNDGLLREYPDKIVTLYSLIIDEE